MKQGPRTIFGITYLIVIGLSLMMWWVDYQRIRTIDPADATPAQIIELNPNPAAEIFYRFLGALIPAFIITAPVDLIRGLRWKAKQKQLPVTPTATVEPPSITQ